MTDAFNFKEDGKHNDREVTKLTVEFLFVLCYLLRTKMDQPSMLSPESLHESKKGLLEDFRLPYEETVCLECKSRRKTHCFQVAPWVFTSILLLILALSTIRSKACVQEGFWRTSDFGRSRNSFIYPMSDHMEKL